MFTGCGGAYRTHSRVHRHKVLKSSCNRNADISCAYRRAYADRDGFPPDSTLVVFFQSVAANDRTRSTLLYRPDFRPVRLAAIGCLCRVSIHARARAHTHTHTEVRCRCSFESFRDNSSRQINLFSPRSNLFSLRETCFYISKSRGSWRSIRRWKSSCHAGNVYIYIFFHRNYEATETFSSFLLWFPRSCVSFPLPLLLSFVAPRFHYPRVTQEPRRKNRSLIGAEGIPIGVVRFASATSAIASKRRITVRTKRNGGE